MKAFDIVREVAEERVAILAKLAEREKDEKLATRYSKLMKRISQHYKVKLPKDVKKRICKGCGVLLVPGKNCRVRLVSSKKLILYMCEDCKKENRIPY